MYVISLLSGVPGGYGASAPIPNVLRIEATEDPIDDAMVDGREA